jgi:hydroxymethylbilane synthase
MSFALAPETPATAPLFRSTQSYNFSAKSYTVGTRKSALALVQTHLVADALAHLHPGTSFPVVHSTTIGDRNQSTPLHLLSPYSSSQPAKSLWTDELEALLAKGDFDLLVHSLKDVPTTLKEGFEIAACMKREDPRDAFVVREGLGYKRIEDLPKGSVIGTGSVRRVAQLKRAFPGLKFEDMVSYHGFDVVDTS